MHLLVRALRHNDLPGAVKETCARVRGAYCLLVMVDGVMVAVRDPHGFHPLAFGRMNGSPVFASETCAFDLLEADFERSVEPGEMIIVDGNSVRSDHLMGPLPEKPRQCIFELVYFARPDSYIFDEQVYLCRKKMGWNLADESAPEVDYVMPFPDSGIYPALGFAQRSGLPYEHAMIRNHYVGRTFIQPSQSMRSFGVRVKINPVREMIDGKRICIIDDSIVRGTTMRDCSYPYCSVLRQRCGRDARWPILPVRCGPMRMKSRLSTLCANQMVCRCSGSGRLHMSTPGLRACMALCYVRFDPFKKR